MYTGTDKTLMRAVMLALRWGGQSWGAYKNTQFCIPFRTLAQHLEQPIGDCRN